MNKELEYRKTLSAIDGMIANHSPQELSEGVIYEEFERLVEESDKYDALLHPIENATTIQIELERIEYVQLIIRARKADKSVNAYINEAIKTAMETYEHETGNRLPQGPSEG